jgi:arylsulfatase A-like enzyme
MIRILYIFPLLLRSGLCSEDEKPNIIFVMSDDVGFADVSFTERIFESKNSIRTPNLDKLSRRGTIFAQHYSHSTCTPSRASFLTGRYAGNTGLNFAMLPGSVAGIPKGMATLPNILRR